MNAMKTALVLVVLSLLPVDLLSQAEEQIKAQHFAAPRLVLETSASDPLVVLMENHAFRVETTRSAFEQSVSDWLSLHKISDDRKLLDLILSESSSVIRADSLAKYEYLEERLNYRIADLLQQDACRIIDKTTDKPVFILKMQGYTYGSPGAQHGGKRYLVKEEVLLDIVTWMN